MIEKRKDLFCVFKQSICLFQKLFYCFFVLFLPFTDFVDKNPKKGVREINDISSERCLLQQQIQREVVLDVEVIHWFCIVEDFQTSHSKLLFNMELHPNRFKVRYFFVDQHNLLENCFDFDCSEVV